MIPVFDGHNDALLSLLRPERGHGRSFFEASEHGHLDLPRAREGGFAGGFFAVFVPNPDDEPPHRITTDEGVEIEMAPPLDPAWAQRQAIETAATLFRLERESAGEIQIVRRTDEIRACLDRGVLAAILHFEGAEPIDEDLNALQLFHAAGLRSLGIVWSRPNRFGHGVPFRCPQSPDVGPGLSDAGKRLVDECNRLGILLDLAHLNEKGFWDVASRTEAPLVVTHACAHTICPSARNVTDRQLDAIRESRGVLGINFYVGDLRPDGKADPETPISQIVRHIAYVVDRLGIDHVAFGSDFDGAQMSAELGDARGLQRLVGALDSHGYDRASLLKLCHENWLRVISETWKD